MRISPLVRSFRCLGLVAAATCASANPEPPSEVGRQPTILTSEQGMLLGERPRAFELRLGVLPTDVWPIVKKVYQALEIPVTMENVQSHLLGNANFYRSRKLGDL